ncbi:hypothetical protein GIB67_008019 [Kingdonia uniflora]|uniref:Uncharacterized protein n=1 Tax=Kingdonia uniflora TaxID=39325 RepID=A0A7J7MXS5_9MAGN|nr:hypothetical protein GIB67_008019 [Kingdonia uniflora]
MTELFDSMFYHIFQYVSYEKARAQLVDVDNLTEEKLDNLLHCFLTDFKEGALESNGWPITVSATRFKLACDSSSRCAVVTGGNKGIGFKICRKLASNGIIVILASRDEKRGVEAAENLKESGLTDVVSINLMLWILLVLLHWHISSKPNLENLTSW